MAEHQPFLVDAGVFRGDLVAHLERNLLRGSLLPGSVMVVHRQLQVAVLVLATVELKVVAGLRGRPLPGELVHQVALCLVLALDLHLDLPDDGVSVLWRHNPHQVLLGTGKRTGDKGEQQRNRSNWVYARHFSHAPVGSNRQHLQGTAPQSGSPRSATGRRAGDTSRPTTAG